MPGLDARAGHVGRDEKRPADQPGVKVIAHALQSRRQEGIRRAADLHAFLGGQVEQLLRFAQCGGKRFFAEQMLARRNDLPVHRDMRLRRGQVDDDVNGVVPEQLFWRTGFGNAELARQRLRAAGVKVCAGCDLQLMIEFLDIRQIGAADHTRAEDAHMVSTHGNIRRLSVCVFDQLLYTVPVFIYPL